jgi:hypothetical protein
MAGSSGGNIVSSYNTYQVASTSNVMGTRNPLNNVGIDSSNNLIVRAGRGDLPAGTSAFLGASTHLHLRRF